MAGGAFITKRHSLEGAVGGGARKSGLWGWEGWRAGKEVSIARGPHQ